MKFYIITGESSGDLHAANLVEELKKCNSELEFRAWGGERLLAQGVELAKHIKETAFMGLLDVLKNLGTIKENLNYCKQDILKYKPDALILVDYPGFNLKIAQFAKQHGIKVFYYISPKVWAWNRSRVNKIKNLFYFLIGSAFTGLVMVIIFFQFFDSPKEKILNREIKQLSTQYEVMQDKLNQVEVVLDSYYDIKVVQPKSFSIATDIAAG